MANVDSLESLLQEELKDLYDAEKQITRALPKMAKKASSDELRQGFENHLRQTEQQIERLEQVFEQLGLPARGAKCKAMQNLISEGDEMVREAEEDATRDAILIAAAQKIEHYEIAGYGTARTWANRLGQEEVAQLLEETLEEEKENDRLLTQVAESLVNPAAAEEGEEGEEDMGAGRGRGASRSVAADRGQRSSRSGSSRSGSSRSRSGSSRSGGSSSSRSRSRR